MKCEECGEKNAKSFYHGRRVCSRCYIIKKFNHTPIILKNKLKKFDKRNHIQLNKGGKS